MTPFLDDGDVTLYHGDAGPVLATIPEASVDCVVTSPPYFGLRDYGYDGQIGLEDTPAAFVARLVDVFREVRRVLSPSGVCWVNMGDSYAANRTYQVSQTKHLAHDFGSSNASTVPDGMKPKDLLGIPWRLAFGLQDDGWWLRSDVIWHKPNPMPESVTDRPTKAHEYLFLLTRSPRYYWDAEGVREDAIHAGKVVTLGPKSLSRGQATGMGVEASGNGKAESVTVGSGRNVRSVWTFPTEPNPEAHFATFPRELVRRCLAAGCPERVCATCGAPSVRVVERTPMVEPPRSETTGWSDCGHDAWRPGVVLDPFIGSGTTAVVARALGLRTVGIDGSAEYLEIAARRTQQLSLLGGAA